MRAMEPDKNIAPEAEKSKYKLESDIDTPGEEVDHLRKMNKRKNGLLVVAALFIIGLGVALVYAIAR